MEEWKQAEPAGTTMPPAVFGPDGQLNGTGQVVIQKDSLALSIELPDSAQVWPTVRARDGGNHDDRNIEKQITVFLLRNGQAVADHLVKITAFRVKGTGGHDHELSDGSPELEQLGRFIFEGDTTEVELEAETDGEGQIELDYQSSVFSGQYVVQAAVFIDGDSLFAKDTLTVSVSNLVPLGESESYILSGGTCGHHGPERPGNPIPARCASPDQIHYIAETAKDSLVAAAKEYLNGSWNTDNAKIRVNDISLALGGYFDINGNWAGAHVSHRVGEDVDIEFKTSTGRFVDTDKLVDIFINNGWTRIQEESSNFPHFRFDN